MGFEVFEHGFGYYKKQYAFQIMHAIVLSYNWLTYYFVLDSFTPLLVGT